MATQVRRHSFDQTPTVFAKIFDEIPTFEEAFDTASLREFFHAYESTNSQSAYSPHKDSFMFEEGHPNHLNDSILTSTSHFFADFPVQDGAKKQQRSFSFNFGSEPKSSRSKLPSQVPIIMEAPFIINQLHRKKSSSKASDKSSDTQRELKDTEIRIKIPRSPVTTEKKSRGKAKKDLENNVESLLKKKQVFKIIRDAKPKETSLNRKRQHSDIVKEDSVPLTKQVKGRRSSRRFSIESNYSVVTNTSETNVAAYNPTVSSQFEQF